MHALRHWLVLIAPLVGLAISTNLPGCGSDSGSTFGDGSGDGGAFADGAGGPFGEGGDPSTNGNFANAACATGSAHALRTPVYMLMVLDGSGSMDGNIVVGDNFKFEAGAREVDPDNPTRPTENDNRDGPGTPGLTGKKWLAARSALNAFWGQLGAQNPTDNGFGVGFYLFSSTSEKPSNAVDVPLRPVSPTHLAALRARVNPTGPGATGIYGKNSTPLRASIRDQGKILHDFTPAAPLLPGGRRVLVVISDGIPFPTNDGNTEANCIAEANSLRTGTPPISTFVIGVGNPTESTSVYDEVFLGDLASAGGTAPAGCNSSWSQSNMSGVPCHFQVTPGSKSANTLRDEFVAAINKIRDSLASCDFPLQKPAGVGQLDPAKVNVLYTAGNGTEKPLVQDAKNGWTYDNPTAPTRVILNGTACNTLKADPNGKIRIVVGCKTETIKVN